MARQGHPAIQPHLTILRSHFECERFYSNASQPEALEISPQKSTGINDTELLDRTTLKFDSKIELNGVSGDKIQEQGLFISRS